MNDTYTGAISLSIFGESHGPAAVSYTHLDVYKRQYMDRSGRRQDGYSENYANRKVWKSSKHKLARTIFIC